MQKDKRSGLQKLLLFGPRSTIPCWPEIGITSNKRRAGIGLVPSLFGNGLSLILQNLE